MRILLLLLSLTLALAPGPAASAQPRSYDVLFSARFVPDEGHAEATIEVTQTDGALTQLDLNAPAPRFSEFSGDGEVSRQGRRLIWQVPADGGKLHYRVLVDRKRGSGYDALMMDDWAVMRLDNLFPAARVRSMAGAFSRSTLSLDGPPGWSFESPYGHAAEPLAVTARGRRFTRPVGWLAAGDIGIRRTVIAGRDFAIAGPRGENFRRMDLLAFLHWTVPELVRIAPSLPSRVLIVGGSEAMWRGGLSGPGSLYVHPARPLLSGNSTSTFLHELMHVAMQGRGAPGDDWIVEGIPEYYSLVILLRTGGISGERFEAALDWQAQWVRRENGRLADPSSGADTSRAVLLFRDLDVELAAAGGRLDRVVEALFGGGEVSRGRLAELVEAELGRPSRVLERALRSAPAGGGAMEKRSRSGDRSYGR